MHSEKEIAEILSELRVVKPRHEFTERMYSRALPPSPPHLFALPLVSLRLALLVLTAVLVSSAGVVAASVSARPGDVLYPVKSTIESIKDDLRPEGVRPSVAPVTSPSSSPSPTPNAVQASPTIPVRPSSTPTSSVEPTQPVDSQVEASVELPLGVGGVSVGLESGLGVSVAGGEETLNADISLPVDIMLDLPELPGISIGL